MMSSGECFGEMGYIGSDSPRRHATVEAMSELLVAEFEPAALERMSLGAQLQLTRADAKRYRPLLLANVLTLKTPNCRLREPMSKSPRDDSELP